MRTKIIKGRLFYQIEGGKHPDTGKRVVRSYLDEAEARKWEKRMRRADCSLDQTPLVMTKREIRDYRQARALVPMHLTLVQAFERVDFLNRSQGEELASVIWEYMDDKKTKGLRLKSLQSMRTSLKPLIKMHGRVPIGDLTPAMLREALRPGMSPLTTNREIRDWNTMFDWATRNGYVIKNPAGGLDMVKSDASEAVPETWTAEELREMLREAEFRGCGQFITRVVLGAFAGVRTAETFRLVAGNTGKHDGYVEVSGTAAKMRRRRLIVKEANLAAWLEKYPIPEGGLDAKLVGEQKDEVLAVTLEPWKKNGLRHSYASNHFGCYANEGLLKKNLGHKSEGDTVFQHYLDLRTLDEGMDWFSIMPTK